MIKLVQVTPGVFDLAVKAATDKTADIETVIWARLLTNAEAVELAAEDRQGWWANPSAGSLLWRMRQQGLTDTVANQVIEHIRTVLSADSALTDIKVERVDSERNVSALAVTITGQHNGDAFTLELAADDN